MHYVERTSNHSTLKVKALQQPKLQQSIVFYTRESFNNFGNCFTPIYAVIKIFLLFCVLCLFIKWPFVCLIYVGFVLRFFFVFFLLYILFHFLIRMQNEYRWNISKDQELSLTTILKNCKISFYFVFCFTLLFFMA